MNCPKCTQPMTPHCDIRNCRWLQCRRHRPGLTADPKTGNWIVEMEREQRTGQ